MDETQLVAVLDDARRIGLLGPEPVQHHIEHARAWAAALEPADFLDLGSGAGIPGLVFALEWPGVSGILLDGQDRRSAWLRTAVARLSLSHRISVVAGRAEELAHDPALRESQPLVVARGFAGPAPTAECASGLVRVGGLVSVSEPPTRPAERWPTDRLQELGLDFSAEVVQDGRSFVILRKVSPLPSGFPRRRNRPTRSPLW